MSLNQDLDFNKICRLCMSKDNVLTSIFTSHNNSNLLFSDMIMSISTVNVTTNDSLPNCVCVKCIDRILKAYSFKIECEKAEKVLQDCSQKRTLNETTQKLNNKRKKKISQICKKANYAPYILTEHFNQLDSNETIEEVISQNNSANIFKCFYCNHAVLTEETLKRHIASKHYRGKLVEQSNDTQKVPVKQCCFCYYVFENEQNLKKHLVAKHLNELNNTHVKQTFGTCHLCGLESKNITLHLNEHYKYLYCNKCKMKFENRQKFENHMKEEMLTSSNIKKLDNCSSTPAHNDATNNIVKQTYQCTHCTKFFLTQGGLNSHLRLHLVQKSRNLKDCV